MTQLVITAVVFLLLLALTPWALRWLRQRVVPGGMDPTAVARIVFAAAVGPQQRVVTLEVGPPGRRVWLVLGVTAQAVTCLHAFPVDESPDRAMTASEA